MFSMLSFTAMLCFEKRFFLTRHCILKATNSFTLPILTTIWFVLLKFVTFVMISVLPFVCYQAYSYYKVCSSWIPNSLVDDTHTPSTHWCDWRFPLCYSYV